MASLSSRSFRMFGPLAPLFQRLNDARNDAAAAKWVSAANHRMAAQFSWEEAKARFYTETGFWYDAIVQIIALSVSKRFSVATLQIVLPALWQKLAPRFSPSLGSWASTATSAAFVEGIAAVSGCYFSAFRVPEVMDVVTTSFASYADDELQYLATHHPNIFEAGGGSGYLANLLSDAGVNVVSVDNYSYTGAYDLSADWHRHAVKRGALLSGDALSFIDRLGPDRTLLIAWAEPGAKYPVEIIREHREKGGKKLVLKLGMFIGAMPREGVAPDYIFPADPVTNVLDLLAELGMNWRQVNDSLVPKFNPDAYLDQMWVFESVC